MKLDNEEQLCTLVRDRIKAGIELKQKLLGDPEYLELLIRIASQITKTLNAGGTLFFFGNGGSAADAQHLAAEFTGRFLKERRPLAALALSVNSSSVTAIGNDYGFDYVFARPLEALGKPGDVAIGITTSGNSPNVLRALTAGGAKSMFTVALTGQTGGLAKDLAHCTICIPSVETPRIQELHILTGHLICELVEEMMFSTTGETPDVAATASPQ